MSLMLKDLIDTFNCRMETALLSDVINIDYPQLHQKIEAATNWLAEQGLVSGEVLGIHMQPTVDSVIVLLACWRHGVSTVLLGSDENECSLACRVRRTFYSYPKRHIECNDAVDGEFEKHLIAHLRDPSEPGFVVFTSGTTAQPKPVLHDVNVFLRDFRSANKPSRLLTISALQTMSGLDSLLYSLLSGGTFVFPSANKMGAVCEALLHYNVETFAATPSFVRLLALSEVKSGLSCASVTTLVLGAEPLNEHTLQLAKRLFPNAQIVQKYGASEFGVLPLKSNDDNPLWFGNEARHISRNTLRVIDGQLWVPMPQSLLGYLDGTALTVDDKWLFTGDRVERKGDTFRMAGRVGTLINTGGALVNPLAVENAILKIEGICDVTVYGEANAVLGEVVCADIVVNKALAPEKMMIGQVLAHCRANLSKTHWPVHVRITEQTAMTAHYKKARRTCVAT